MKIEAVGRKQYAVRRDLGVPEKGGLLALPGTKPGTTPNPLGFLEESRTARLKDDENEYTSLVPCLFANLRDIAYPPGSSLGNYISHGRPYYINPSANADFRYFGFNCKAMGGISCHNLCTIGYGLLHFNSHSIRASIWGLFVHSRIKFAFGSRMVHSHNVLAIFLSHKIG